jgi:hypothetical protein
MPELQQGPNRCPQCGLHYPGDVFVCPDCQEILTLPPAKKPTSPGLIALLVTVIVLLAAYAGYLAYQVFVLRQY